MKELIYPTKEHKEYVLMLKKYCEDNNIGLFILGSLANGTAKKHSDIDIVLVSNNMKEHIEELTKIYSKPVIKSVTENPKGILILIFKSGLCIDMDLREKICINEVADMVEVVSPYRDLITDEVSLQRSNLPYLLYKSELEWQDYIEVIDRSLIKYLNGKFSSANTILNELKDSIQYLQIKEPYSDSTYVEQIIIVLNAYSEHYDLNSDFIDMINNLIIECTKIN